MVRTFNVRTACQTYTDFVHQHLRSTVTDRITDIVTPNAYLLFLEKAKPTAAGGDAFGLGDGDIEMGDADAVQARKNADAEVRQRQRRRLKPKPRQRGKLKPKQARQRGRPRLLQPKQRRMLMLMLLLLLLLQSAPSFPTATTLQRILSSPRACRHYVALLVSPVPGRVSYREH